MPEYAIVRVFINERVVYAVHRYNEASDYYYMVGKKWFSLEHARLEELYFTNQGTYYELNQIINKNPDSYM